ncbi:Glucose dehydrogenase, partial [Eumeta japonica]
MLSGVGPSEVLRPLQIPVIHHLPVGENLQDHVSVLIFFKIPGNNLDPKQFLDAIYQFLIHAQGPLTSHGTASLTGFINTQPHLNSSDPDVE